MENECCTGACNYYPEFDPIHQHDGYGQDPRLQRLRELGRDTLISMAKAQLLGRQPDFDFDTFSHIRVMTGDELLYVSFSVPYKYVPLNYAAKYTLSVHLYGNNGFGSTLYKNQAETSLDTEFYKPAPDHEKVIRFLIDAVSEDGNVTSIADAVHKWDFKVTIHENEDHYTVNMSSESGSNGYKVEKGSARIFDQWHKHRAPSRSDIYEITK